MISEAQGFRCRFLVAVDRQLDTSISPRRGADTGIAGAAGTSSAICVERSEQAAQRLFELMEDEDGRVALMAVSAVLDRGIGKPRDHSDEDNALSRLNLAAISPEEQRLLISLLRRVMGVESPAPQIEASTEASSAKPS